MIIINLIDKIKEKNTKRGKKEGKQKGREAKTVILAYKIQMKLIRNQKDKNFI